MPPSSHFQVAAQMWQRAGVIAMAACLSGAVYSWSSTMCYAIRDTSPTPLLDEVPVIHAVELRDNILHTQYKSNSIPVLIRDLVSGRCVATHTRVLWASPSPAAHTGLGRSAQRTVEPR